jgi:hypothetical protein
MSSTLSTSKPVLVRQTKSLVVGGKVVSTEVLYEKPKVAIPQPSPPPAIKKPESPVATPTSPSEKQRPEFLEPLTSSPKADAFRKAFYEDMKKREQEYYEWESRQPSTYRREIEHLERRREKYNKKASWSGKDAAEVDRIDKDIAANQKMIDWLEKQREEEEWYSDEESE